MGSHADTWSVEELTGWCPGVGTVLVVACNGLDTALDGVVDEDPGDATASEVPVSTATVALATVGSDCIITDPSRDWRTVCASARPSGPGW